MLGSSRASVMQRMISSIVSGRKAFLFSGLLMVICASHPAQTSTHRCTNLAAGNANDMQTSNITSRMRFQCGALPLLTHLCNSFPISFVVDDILQPHLLHRGNAVPSDCMPRHASMYAAQRLDTFIAAMRTGAFIQRDGNS